MPCASTSTETRHVTHPAWTGSDSHVFGPRTCVSEEEGGSGLRVGPAQRHGDAVAFTHVDAALPLFHGRAWEESRGRDGAAGGSVQPLNCFTDGFVSDGHVWQVLGQDLVLGCV